MDIGARLLVALAEAGDVIAFRKLVLRKEFFLGAEVELFDFVVNHVAKYSALPKVATLAENFAGLPKAVEPVKYYADQVEQRYTHRTLNAALVVCSDSMKVMDTLTAKATLIEALINIRGVETRTSLAEFTQEAHPLYMGAYEKKQTEDIPEILTGWPALDKYGGLRSGDVMSVIGRPALGKTFSLLSMAVHAAFRQSLRVLFISMEMPMMEIMERLVAMYAHFPMDHIQNYELTTAQQKKLPGVLLQAKKEKGKLWVLDGNFASTVEGMFSLVYQLNPHVLLIDGAYLIGHPDRHLDRYRRAEINMEMIKRRASEFGIPVAQTYQFNRAAVQKQKKSKGKEHGGLEDIAFSDSIGQISSVVIGMFEDETIETLVGRELHVLKGRKGQTGTFKINWNFETMDFSQIMDDDMKKKGELQFV